jgi:hypothetical protein
MFALPNVHVTFPIEVDGFALVPPDDFRIRAIASEQKRFGSFMKKFKTEFGDRVHPSVIIWRRDKPGTYRTISAISGFRDLISLSVVPIAWEKRQQSRRCGDHMPDYSHVPHLFLCFLRSSASVGLDPRLFGTHSLRRTKATLIYRRAGNLRAVQLLLGHSSLP